MLACVSRQAALIEFMSFGRAPPEFIWRQKAAAKSLIFLDASF